MKVIRNKLGVAVSLGILIVVIVCAIVFRKFFYCNDIDYKILNGNLKVIGTKRVDIRVVFFFLVCFLVSLFFLIKSFIWKLEYNEKGFSVASEDIHWLDFDKIEKVEHYWSPRFRHAAVDKIIIDYSSYIKGESLKFKMSNYPSTKEMKQFFSYMREQNPSIKFSHVRATFNGIEESGFDLFFEKKDL